MGDRRLFLILPARDFEALARAAETDCRSPRHEAQYLLREALKTLPNRERDDIDAAEHETTSAEG